MERKRNGFDGDSTQYITGIKIVHYYSYTSTFPLLLKRNLRLVPSRGSSRMTLQDSDDGTFFIPVLLEEVALACDEAEVVAE
jgi:hypothetical protein